jgi:hypothetical protein
MLNEKKKKNSKDNLLFDSIIIEKENRSMTFRGYEQMKRDICGFKRARK